MYHDTYLESDAIQLACIFEEFRKLCLKFHKLDPVNYFSFPGFSFDSALRKCDAELQLITDVRVRDQRRNKYN